MDGRFYFTKLNALAFTKELLETGKITEDQACMLRSAIGVTSDEIDILRNTVKAEEAATMSFMPGN